MDPLLKIIAREYSERYGDLKRFCFLFPNKRCGVFFKKYLAEAGKKSEELPHIFTISEFVAQVAGISEALRIEQLFALYKAYMDIVDKDETFDERKIPDFEKFRGWGEIVLSDFNIVDTYLVDPDEIFKNVKDYREIASNFLTEEQKEVMQEYFGIDATDNGESFWKNFNTSEELSPLKKEFINLWQILAPLHEKFIKILNRSGHGTTGDIYKKATERILQKGGDAIPYEKMVVIGFNALTESERRIFKKLKDISGYPGKDDFADFIWDITGPILQNPDFSASRFVNYNKRKFPEPEWIKGALRPHKEKDYPYINIISSPSGAAQAKIAAEILREFNSHDQLKDILEAQTALVLPDETLLTDVLYSIPDNIGPVNLTMSYSMKMSGISAFMSLVRSLYLNMRERRDYITYQVKDLRMLFSHPFSYLLFNEEEITRFLEYVDNEHKITVTLEELSSYIPETAQLLRYPSKENKENKIFPLIQNLLLKLKEGTLNDQFSAGDKGLNVEQIELYNKYLILLEKTINKYHLQLSSSTIVNLVNKIIENEKIGFEGEPLSGLQIMGTLETRSLDFKELIILSMNEGVMPRKALSSTFIPENLRRAFGLPPARYAEEIFGYYFYNLISKAEKVTLIYDARTGAGLKGGESRYILQLLQFAPKEKINLQSRQFRLNNRPQKNISIEKTPEIQNKIASFCSEENDRKNFSASSLNSFRECGVRFFLQNIMNINSDPERTEFMDSITIGDILHNVMMRLYMPEKQFQAKLLKEPIVIDKDYLRDLLENDIIIENLVKDQINSIYYRKSDSQGEPIDSGVTEIIGRQIKELVIELLKHDFSLAPFNLYGCEISRKIRIKLNSGREVNFKFAIDRLDEINLEGSKHLRIVDYKTGALKKKAEDLSEVFAGGYKSEQIFQLFTYAWLLGKIGMKGWEDVMTEIYSVPELIKKKNGLPVIGGDPVVSFRPFIEEFSDNLDKMIERIFNEECFNSTSDTSACNFCSFRSFCNK